jgi:hypothetical protein
LVLVGLDKTPERLMVQMEAILRFLGIQQSVAAVEEPASLGLPGQEAPAAGEVKITNLPEVLVLAVKVLLAAQVLRAVMAALVEEEALPRKETPMPHPRKANRVVAVLVVTELILIPLGLQQLQLATMVTMLVAVLVAAILVVAEVLAPMPQFLLPV